jgi:poly(beta-D-mannuronate) C5 epimerase
MRNLARRCRAVGMIAMIAAASFVGGTTADAATCALPVRYSATSDTTYLTASGPVDTLTEIKAACPAAPMVQPSPGVWELNSDLVVQGGATLNLSGDVKVLRLQSLPSGLTKDVSALIAQWGTINMNGVTVTSWNGTGPDTDLTVPSGGTRGRAFVRAVSFMEGSTPRESRMDIVNSDLGFLGYNAAESYGVSYKARGCGATTLAICDALDVLGKQTGSTFHDNYIGTYTWGANNMTFDGNKYIKNKYYGLDPHDDSDNLTITNNLFEDNGNHGLICSQRCDHLIIKHNTSRHNTSTSAETHGIMLHRGVTYATVEDNTVVDNTTGGGIVVFDSVGNSIKNNTVTGNKYGLRFSVGTRGLTVENNKVTGSLQYAVYTYKGSDAPSFTGSSGRPTGITFTGNTFNGAGAELFKIQDSDGFTFTGGSIKPGTLTKGPKFERAAGHVFGPVTMPSGTTTFTLRGTSAVKTTLAIKGTPAPAVKIDKDAYSSATFDGTTVAATPTATATTTPTVSAPTPAADTAMAAPTAAPTATLPVVVNAPNSPIVAPTGVAEAPPAVGETTP